MRDTFGICFRDAVARGTIASPCNPAHTEDGVDFMTIHAASALASLFRQAVLVKPNVPEVEALLGRQITDRESIAAAAADLLGRRGCAVLLKGGHLGLADDCLASAEGITWVGVPAAAGGSAHCTGRATRLYPYARTFLLSGPGVVTITWDGVITSAPLAVAAPLKTFSTIFLNSSTMAPSAT